MGTDLHVCNLLGDRSQEPAQLAAANARIAELVAENTALRAGLLSRDETIARLAVKLRSLEAKPRIVLATPDQAEHYGRVGRDPEES